MLNIRYATKNDVDRWLILDKRISKDVLFNKIERKEAYVLTENEVVIGVLRYGLFWDSVPFCNMLYVDENYQKNGYGTWLVKQFEKDMKKFGYDVVLTSTRVDETAQFFYRKLGYKDCGGLLFETTKEKQPMELFLIKEL